MKPALPLPAAREQALAFRLASQHLAGRLPPGALPAAADVGIQNTPPGAAILALHARLRDLTPAQFDRALEDDKTLLQLWSLRGAPYVIPTADAGLFTAGVLPDDEESLRFFIIGCTPLLDQLGTGAAELLDLAAPALHATLDGRALNKDQLGVDLAGRVAQHLAARIPPEVLAAYRSPIAGQSFLETIMRYLMALLALQGGFCIAPRRGDETRFMRTDQWLGAPLPAVDPAAARAGLVRRYLHHYGPSSAGHFAAWAGISPAQARRAWQLVQTELTAVDFAGRHTWLHRDDVEGFAAPPTAAGVRFLPPHDPYLACRDRETLIPDKKLHAGVWRSVGNPGVILAGGELVAAWRPRKRGARLTITLQPFAGLSSEARRAIESEAGSLAIFRGCTSVEVEFA